MSATELDPNEPNLEDEQKPVLFDIQLKNRLETDFQRYYEVSKEDPGDDDFPETAKTPENVMSATDLDPNEGVMVATEVDPNETNSFGDNFEDEEKPLLCDNQLEN